MISRLLRPIAIGLGFGLAMVMLVAFLSEDSGDAAASNEPVRVRPAAVTQKVAAPDIDALVAQILERPLFSSSRQPADAAPEEVAEAPKEPPKMPGRLEGVSIRPEAREALFEREGDKPLVVKEGQEIDGWMVASIRPDEVLLKSELGGEQIVKPANGAGIKPPQMAMKKKPGPAGKKPNGLAGAAGAAKPPALPQRSGVPPTQRPAQTTAQPNPRTGR
ncbi:MAG TPA: hypothetical protein VNH44_10985 [Micropepsaceae bacterium]|nr:hypothetical protein [Micropepsaceae bacterium]